LKQSRRMNVSVFQTIAFGAASLNRNRSCLH
jgi:hypothetical protein